MLPCSLINISLPRLVLVLHIHQTPLYVNVATRSASPSNYKAVGTAFILLNDLAMKVYYEAVSLSLKSPVIADFTNHSKMKLNVAYL
jgi:hypothetical protein